MLFRSAAQMPRTRSITYGDPLVWDCNSADIWDMTLFKDTTAFVPPEGPAYDGQVVLLRLRQPAGGGKKVTFSSDTPRFWSTNGTLPHVIAQGEFAVTSFKLRYMGWADRWSIVELIRHNL